ncbi:tetratricopeptide repeat protein [Synoicihabitans lomoniglobus]|uniref:Tetratricopeptide repeat protein n=1 Tax=Synoicihabitans lomoniglobus TaxID=2909285 RepID=A0AAE9ZTL1_9BACT|nr:tetratricopeptide repeat protein [Opitutaceae bacterium LMO-M01]WED64935.1 tetratricopeptide repeat protein [Opitutaceae bacterium LMO-M01]
MKSKPVIRLLIVVGGLGLAAGGWWWYQASQQQAQVAAWLPAVPALADASDELSARITAADERALSLTNAVAGLAELSRLYHANGYYDSALASYDALARIQPTEARWPHRHASILAGYGQAEPAIVLWQRTIELAPAYVPARLRLADLLLKSNQPQAAADAYRATLDVDRDNAWAILGLARIDYEAERWADARRHLERVVALTNYALGYDLIVSLYERLGLEDRAAAIRGRAEASGAFRDPPDPWLDELMADCYDPFRLALEAGTKARSGDPTTAIAWLERAIAVAPADLSAHFQLANLLVQQRDTSRALALYRRCTQLDPAFADGWAQLSGLQAQLGNDVEAERTLAAGLEAVPDSPGLHLMRARKLRAADRVGAAIAEYRTSIRLRPNEPRAYIELAVALIDQNRSDEAIALIREALVYDPANPTALGIMAFKSIESGDRTAAEEWLAKVEAQPRIEPAQADRIRAAFARQFGAR